MLRSPFIAELFDDVLFFNRPFPPEDSDFILYIEEQISELLFAEETLSDIVYRFTENPQELLIAVARKKTLAQKPLPAGRLCYRIPAAVDIYLKARHALKPETPSFVYAIQGNSRYLILADARNLCRVFRLKNSAGPGPEMAPIIDSVREKYFPENAKAVLFSREPLPESLKAGLRERPVEVMPIEFPKQAAADATVAGQWDFRLQSEIDAQELNRWKNRVVRAGAITAAGIAIVYLLLFCCAGILDSMEQRSARKWAALSPSLKEITYLQKQTRDLINEIKLCRKLSERRTARAAVLETVAATRPAEVFLDELRIDARKPLREKTDGMLTLKGFSVDDKGMTGWMEQLLKSKIFLSVNLVSMEKKGAVYRFQIECALSAR